MLTGPEKAAYLERVAKEYFTWDFYGSVSKVAGTFVETGTAGADTTKVVAPLFERTFTVEIGVEPYNRAWSHFIDDPSVTCLWGDSAIVMEYLCPLLKGPALFWLDAHFCGGDRAEDDTPVVAELQTIFRYRSAEKNIILIDDARLFGTDPEYPPVSWVEHQAYEFGYETVVKDDIIHVSPAADAYWVTAGGNIEESAR